MFKLPNITKQDGFSLTELMVVVAIITIMTTFALPQLRIYQARARQTEAKINLNHIYALQQAYHAEQDTYALMGATPVNGVSTPNDLGFVLENATKARYTYTVTTADATNFLATARSGDRDQNKVRPGCPADQQTINQDRNLVHQVNTVALACTGAGGAGATAGSGGSGS